VRNLASCLLTIVVLFSAMARAEEWEHTYPVTGTPEVIVDTNEGDVEVVVGSSQEVEARVVTHGWKLNDDLRIEASGTQNRIELRLHEKGKFCFGACFQSIHVQFRVPRQSELNVHTGDGNVRVDGVQGNQRIETNDGDIRLHDLEGSLRAHTHDGNVQVTGSFDLLELRTGDGDIDAEVNKSSAPKLGWTFRSGDGNVRLRLPNDFRADLSAQTGDGNISVGFQLDASELKSEHAVRGKINGGGTPIELHTGDGDISLERI
jgi:Putative adhesin